MIARCHGEGVQAQLHSGGPLALRDLRALTFPSRLNPISAALSLDEWGVSDDDAIEFPVILRGDSRG